MDEQRPWHRLFSLAWTDFFRGLPVTVDVERDLSVKKQLLDIVLIHLAGSALACRLPDGFENLSTYNLVTFKSYQEKLTVWSLLEIIGHFVNLRKQVSPSMKEDDLLPWENFRLFAVAAPFPRNLLDDHIPLEQIQSGVYDIQVLTQRIRLVVVSQLPQEEHNALLHLFSASGPLFAYGAQHYRIRSAETSSLLLQLVRRYQEGVLTMPDILEEFTREFIDSFLKTLPAKKRLEGLSAAERMKDLSPEERLKGLSVEEQIAALSPQAREALVRQSKTNGSPPNPQ